jgi:energy-coupling factor transporter ATP-binding protein EcfA2
MTESQKPVRKAVQPGKELLSSAKSGKDLAREAFENAETIQLHDGRETHPLENGRIGRRDEAEVHVLAAESEEPANIDPIVPLGHDGGNYYFIPPSGQLRKFTAEALEAGRGVRALFAGISPVVDEWCHSKFPTRDNGWSHKEAGLWIIEKCNANGVFEPSSADLRSIGVWRDDTGGAVSHCGNHIIYPDGRSLPLTECQAKHIMIGARPIAAPDLTRLPDDSGKTLLHEVDQLWGWKRDVDSAIWLGWVAAACMGGFPDWRSHLYVHGSRGSGKSKLIELAACLLGDLSGEVINDATEAGLRQSRNNQARPLLIDEFEPDDNPRNASRQDSMLALFRRMSGGDGGRISRGGADHSPVSFRILGAAYVTSINHIHLEPQDRSRFIVLELQSLPGFQDSADAAIDFDDVFRKCRKMSARLRGRMLSQSVRWDRTHAAIVAKARSVGADARQAATAATILAGLDLALFDGVIDNLRMEDLEVVLNALIADSGESDEVSEGRDALDHLLSSSLALDHGFKRTVREILSAAMNQEGIIGVDDPSGALRRHGVYVDMEQQHLALRTGRSTPTSQLYAGTKWRNGAHASALAKLEGASRPTSAVRLSPNEQHRVVIVPIACLGLARSA